MLYGWPFSLILVLYHKERNFKTIWLLLLYISIQLVPSFFYALWMPTILNRIDMIYIKKKKKKKELLLASTKSPERLMICFWQTKQYYYCLYNVYRQFLRHSRSTKSSFVWSPESGGRSTRPINPRNIFFSISFSFLSLLSAHTHTHKSFLV